MRWIRLLVYDMHRPAAGCSLAPAASRAFHSRPRRWLLSDTVDASTASYTDEAWLYGGGQGLVSGMRGMMTWNKTVVSIARFRLDPSLLSGGPISPFLLNCESPSEHGPLFMLRNGRVSPDLSRTAPILPFHSAPEPDLHLPDGGRDRDAAADARARSPCWPFWSNRCPCDGLGPHPRLVGHQLDHGWVPDYPGNLERVRGLLEPDAGLNQKPFCSSLLRAAEGNPFRPPTRHARRQP